ncbi:hypothetical protein JCM12296A_35430 [Desulfosarcina cetonica]
MIFSFAEIPPYSTKVISIHACLEICNTPADSYPDSGASAASVDLSGACEKKKFRNLAEQLRSDTPRKTAENIYHWIGDTIQYSGYSREEKGACYAFTQKKGDCTEFADLFVELAHAAGVPARRVSGYLSPEGSGLAPSAYHDWAEFYEDGTWRIADAQQRNFDTHYRDYVAMRIGFSHSDIERPTHFRQFRIEGKGLTVKMD